MLPSQIGKTSISLLLALTVTTFAGTVLAADPPKPCHDTYTTAIRLMRAFYPELSGKGATMQVNADYPFDADGPLMAFAIGLSESDQLGRVVAKPYPQPLSSAERLGHLSAHFVFHSGDHRIFLIFASGSFLNDEKRQALIKLVEEHPQWSESQMAEALSAAGAKFGPTQKDALLAKFPVKELEPIVGKIDHTSANFVFLGNIEPPISAMMDWSIRFRATKDGQSDEYTVSLEPFEGKMISLGRRSLGKEKQLP